jgi:hypothetical protein
MPFLSFRRRPASNSEPTPAAAQQHVQEQINPTSIASSPTQEDWYWGRMATGDEEDFWWRRLSDNWYMKDVLPSTYLELHNLCYEAYNANPLAFAVIEITTSFVLGKGVTVAASQPEVQRVLLDFWNDPDNHMDTRVYALCTELALYGEQFIRFFVNPYSGRVKIRQIDPSIIDEIETDPDDIETILRFHCRPVGSSATQPGDPAPIRPDEQQNCEGAWFLAGQEMLQFTIIPEIDVDDHQILASATQTLVTALSAAKAQGWVSDETAMRLLFQFAGEEVDIAQERARMHSEETH